MKKVKRFLIVFLFLIPLVGCSNIHDDENLNLYENTDLKDIEEKNEENNINKMSLEQFETFISESITNEISSEEIDVETHFTATGVSINFIYNTFKTKEEYKVSSRSIVEKVKEKCNGKYIENKYEPYVYINFYISKSVVREMLDSGHMKKSIIGYKVPYEIGGCTITKNGNTYTESDYENCNRPEIVNFYDYID